MKKVLIITYYWPPSGGPGVQRCVKFAKYLSFYGIEPVIVTVDPKKASYPIIDFSLTSEVPQSLEVHKTNTFEILNYYTRFISGGQIPHPGFSNESNPGTIKKLARYIRGNFFIPDARIGWNSFLLKKCRELIKLNDFSAIFSSSPPHSSQLTALKLSRESGLPWIADLRDPWTDIYFNKYLFRSKRAQLKDERLEKMILLHADAIVTVSPSLKALFASKSENIDPAKIHVIPNGYDPEDFLFPQLDTSEIFNITYTGTISDQYPVSGFIYAVKKMLNRFPELKLNINLVGQVSDGIMRKFSEERLLEHVKLFGYREHTFALKAMRAANVLLLLIPEVRNNKGILTGKLFEYLAARRPLLGFGPSDGDAAAIISDCNSGQMFGIFEKEKAASWLLDMYKSFHEGRPSVAGNNNVEKYSRQAQTQYLAELIQSLR